jgi:hypothetical protein
LPDVLLFIPLDVLIGAAAGKVTVTGVTLLVVAAVPIPYAFVSVTLKV